MNEISSVIASKMIPPKTKLSNVALVAFLLTMSSFLAVLSVDKALGCFQQPSSNGVDDDAQRLNQTAINENNSGNIGNVTELCDIRRPPIPNAIIIRIASSSSSNASQSYKLKCRGGYVMLSDLKTTFNQQPESYGIVCRQDGTWETPSSLSLSCIAKSDVLRRQRTLFETSDVQIFRLKYSENATLLRQILFERFESFEHVLGPHFASYRPNASYPSYFACSPALKRPTVLLRALACNSSLDYIRFLVEPPFEAQLADRDELGSFAVFNAALMGNLAVLELIFSKLSETSSQVNWINEGLLASRPIHVSAINGHTPIVELLLDKGAELEAKDANGQTALSLAFHQLGPSSETVRMLLSRGADVDTRRAFRNRTLLIDSVLLMQRSKVEFLLLNNASGNVQDDDGRSALMHLIISHQYQSFSEEGLELAQLLFASDDPRNQSSLVQVMDLNLRDRGGNTALHLLAANLTITDELFEVAKLIVEYFQSFSHDASSNNNNNIAPQQVNFEAENERGERAIDIAICLKHYNLVRLLVDFGAKA